MEIAKILFLAAFMLLGICWLCNVLSLFAKPHKWCELFIFFQLVWVILGFVGLEYFVPPTKLQWYLGTYGYPILLWPVQIWSWHKFFSIYKEQIQQNEKFLYLAVTSVITMIMLSLCWILMGYAFIWSRST